MFTVHLQFFFTLCFYYKGCIFIAILKYIGLWSKLITHDLVSCYPWIVFTSLLGRGCLRKLCVCCTKIKFGTPAPMSNFKCVGGCVWSPTAGRWEDLMGSLALQSSQCCELQLHQKTNEVRRMEEVTLTSGHTYMSSWVCAHTSFAVGSFRLYNLYFKKID